jgi:hypothetical protein
MQQPVYILSPLPSCFKIIFNSFSIQTTTRSRPRRLPGCYFSSTLIHSRDWTCLIKCPTFFICLINSLWGHLANFSAPVFPANNISSKDLIALKLRSYWPAYLRGNVILCNVSFQATRTI